MSLFHKFRGFTLEWGWEEIVPSSGSEPSGNRGGAAFTRDGANEAVLIGGVTQAGTDLSDYWRFDFGTKQWTQVVASGLSGIVQPRAYADGAGNILLNGNGNPKAWHGTSSSKIGVSTGTQTALTDSGSTIFGSLCAWTADIANKTVFAAAANGTTREAGDELGKAVHSTAGNTNTRSALTSAVTGRSQESSPAYYPAGNALYMLAPARAYSAGAWTLGSGDIIKYDLTAATGWAVETGVSNSAGAVPMPFHPNNRAQMVWCAPEAKFFIFVPTPGASDGGVGRVLTYDPASKVIAEALFSGQPAARLLGEFDGSAVSRGNAGTVVVTGSEFFFVTAWALSSVTNARIWKFRRN